MKCKSCNGDGKEKNYFGVIIGICPECNGTGVVRYTNGDNVRKMNDKELEILFDKIEMYARRCEQSNWHKCDSCECPWCDRDGEIDFEKWLKKECHE